ncbi:kinase-like protein [Daldinia eschscholtzii]|nr:kinase-like protein [Daldinia eschscholtzii]
MSPTTCKCASCGHNLSRSSYATDEFSKGSGVARCKSCNHEYPVKPSIVEFDSGRYNISQKGVTSYFRLGKPFSQGSFRWVALATYLTGPRNGQTFVVKWFKTGFVYEAEEYNFDIKAVDKALEIVNKFNSHNIINRTIRINVPEVWVFTKTSGRWAGRYVLCEPFIQNYQKFNSNNGWTDVSSEWGQAMQALSHFSYHITGGQLVLCDLQGGIYRHEAILSDPVILSRKQEYGQPDFGTSGIRSFFSRHRCTVYCRQGWAWPTDVAQIYDPVPRTSRTGYIIPTNHTRPMETAYYHDMRKPGNSNHQ